MAFSRVLFNPGFFQKQYFTGNNLITAGHVWSKLLQHGSTDGAVLSELRWSSFCGKGAPERSSSGVLEARWSKFLDGKSWLKRTRLNAIFSV
jgi:hypothetical protein